MASGFDAVANPPPKPVVRGSPFRSETDASEGDNHDKDHSDYDADEVSDNRTSIQVSPTRMEARPRCLCTPYHACRSNISPEFDLLLGRRFFRLARGRGQREEAIGAPRPRRRAVGRRRSRSARSARRCAPNSKCATTMPMLAEHAGCRDRQSSARPAPAKGLPLEPLVDHAPAIGRVGDQRTLMRAIGTQSTPRSRLHSLRWRRWDSWDRRRCGRGESGSSSSVEAPDN